MRMCKRGDSANLIKWVLKPLDLLTPISILNKFYYWLDFGKRSILKMSSFISIQSAILKID